MALSGSARLKPPLLPGPPAPERPARDGVRIQQCRAAVLAAFASQPDRAWSAKDLCLHLDGQQIQARLTMLYRVLKGLADEGVVVREWADHCGRMNAVFSAKTLAPPPRTLLVCTRCQRSLPLRPSEALAALATEARAAGFGIDRAQRLQGLCAGCSAPTARG